VQKLNVRTTQKLLRLSRHTKRKVVELITYTLKGSFGSDVSVILNVTFDLRRGTRTHPASKAYSTGSTHQTFMLTHTPFHLENKHRSCVYNFSKVVGEAKPKCFFIRTHPGCDRLKSDIVWSSYIGKLIF
jgi:hypothetical protein